MDKANEVVAWLAGTTNYRDIVPVKVTIGEEVYFGARYTAVGHYESGMMAVQSGDKQVGEEYTEIRYFLIGKLPKTYKKNRRGEQKIVYRLPGDDRDWFISGHYQGGTLSSFQRWPYNFMLGCWTCDEAIDQYDEHKRGRLQITVEEL